MKTLYEGCFYVNQNFRILKYVFANMQYWEVFLICNIGKFSKYSIIYDNVSFLLYRVSQPRNLRKRFSSNNKKNHGFTKPRSSTCIQNLLQTLFTHKFIYNRSVRKRGGVWRGGVSWFKPPPVRDLNSKQKYEPLRGQRSSVRL